MLRVYLDLNKWIDLSRAIGGKPDGERFKTVATMIRAAVEQDQASFPLSIGHYFETWKKRSSEQRHELARTMAAVSCNHAIAPHALLLPGELDRALQRRFGRPTSPRPLQPFGRGLAHSSGGLAPAPPRAMRALVLAANPGLGQDELAHALDGLMLAGPIEDMPLDGIGLPPMTAAEEFAQAQNEYVRLHVVHGDDRETRRRGVAARELEDIFDSLEEALTRARIDWGEFLALTPDGVTEFMLDLPSRAAGLELMWRQHDNTQTVWEPNDLADIGYLSAAVGYCDIVVTERRWTHMLNASGAAERATTIVISDLADLTELLATASVARD